MLWDDMIAPWRVFSRCKWDVAAGMSGIIWTGISSAEIESAARLVKVDLDETVLDDIRTLETVAGRILNKRESGK